MPMQVLGCGSRDNSDFDTSRGVSDFRLLNPYPTAPTLGLLSMELRLKLDMGGEVSSNLWWLGFLKTWYTFVSALPAQLKSYKLGPVFSLAFTPRR